MTDILTLRDLPQVAPPEAPAVAKTSAIATGIANVQSEVAKFDQIAAGLRAIESAHPKNVIVGAIETSAGMKVAEAGWRAYRNPRLEVERARKAAKQPVLALGRAIDDFAGQLESTLREGEDHYKAQIDAETARQEAARRERERIEAERVAKLNAGLDTIRSYLTRCQQPGMTSARIEAGIAMLGALAISAEQWQEYEAKARETQAETLQGMRTLLVEVLAREEEAARVEAQRQENERQAAELAALKKKIDDENAALEKRAAEFRADQERQRIAAQQAEDAAAARQAEADALAKARATVTEPPTHYPSGEPMFSTTTFKDNGEPIMLDRDGKRSIFCDIADDMELPEGQGSQQVLKAEPATADATACDAPAEASPRVGAMGAGQAADAAPVAETPPEIPVLSLSIISDRLGFIVNAKFMASLGFEAVAVKASRLYRESDWPAICDAIIKHVKAVRDQ